MTNMDYYEAGKAFAPEKRTLTAQDIFEGALNEAQYDDTMPAPFLWLKNQLPYLTQFTSSVVRSVSYNTAVQFKQSGVTDDDLFVQTVLARCAWAGLGTTMVWMSYAAEDIEINSSNIYNIMMQGQPISNIGHAIVENTMKDEAWPDDEIAEINDYLENVSCFAYGAVGVRFTQGSHPEAEAYNAMFLFGIAFGLGYFGRYDTDRFFFDKLEIWVDGQKRAAFLLPHVVYAESDFNDNPDYIKGYYSIGLGAPVDAVEYCMEGGKYRKNNEFSYTLVGNSITFKTFLAKFNTFHDYYKVEQLNQKENMNQIICSFSSQEKSHEMYQTFDGIANVGAYEGQDPQSGRYMIQLDFYPQLSIEN